MPRYIALLRAINVGGARIIKMEDLRRHFAIRGFSNIATYIQSGNVLFDTKETDKQLITGKIERKLLKVLSYEVKVMLRSLEEMQRITEQDPFKTERKETDKYYVVFLSAPPEPQLAKDLLAFNNKVDSFNIIGDNLYWLCRKDKGESIVTSSFFEKKLKVFATNRNWNTVNKVLVL